MAVRRLVHHLSVYVLIVSLLLSSAGPAVQAQEGGPVWLPFVGSGGSAAPASDLLFRTRVSVETPAAWRDLERLDPLFLERGEDWAFLLVDDEQLESLARLRYNPDGTDTLEALAQTNGMNAQSASSLQTLFVDASALRQQLDVQTVTGATVDTASQRANLRTALHSLDAPTQTTLAVAVSADSDNDGLNDTLEGYWCTDVNDPDSDFDGIQDGAEVTVLKQWMNNELSRSPESGKPFLGWPPEITGCTDSDKDAVPDRVETFELGLNPNRESTDRDKFDDGQELFGNTHCTGAGGFCSYGPLPRNEDWGVIFAEMPSWVKAPGNHPLVAAFPVPEIDVVESSLRMETVTEITSGHTIGEGVEQSYSTAKTQGTSTSLANTVTWNEWQEASESLQQRVPALKSSDPPNPVPVPTPAPPPGLGFNQGNTSGASIGFPPIDCFEVEGSISVGSSDLLPVTVEGEVGIKVNGEYWDLRCRRALRERGVLDNDSGNSGIPSGFDSGMLLGGFAGMQYAYLHSGEMIADRLYDISQILAAPVRTTTQTTGKSYGGSQTTTHEQYEEQTITNGESFFTEESWSTATAIDTAHAADLWFTYKVRNTGTEYAREITNLAFNVYIGDDPNPAITYFVAPDIGGDGKFVNFMPGEEHQYTARRIPISLEQMAAIDLGGPLRIIVEDFAYGIDELFYQDAANAGVLVAMEDGTDDGDELIDSYLIPTWGTETVLNVLKRYFPHETDANGMLTAIWTPEYRSDTPAWCQEARRPTDQPSKVLWCKHTLSTAEWWNVYSDGLGDGSEGFQDTQAAPGSVALFRFNQDSDLDGFSDRSEDRLGTDPNDAVSFPKPELLAGVHSIQAGNRVTATLSLLNTGLYDAYGVEAVMVAPDDSISITNNTVGGSGRVRALKQVVVGSRIVPQDLSQTPWNGQNSHAAPNAGGYYTGNADRAYTFTVNCGNAEGCKVGEGAWSLGWNDGAGSAGILPAGVGYASPTFLTVGVLGLTLALYSGAAKNGESFIVAARTPRDTFQYTIVREPYTEPLVIVSYNDPQGNHRFVLPPQAMSLSAPTDNLSQFAGQMLPDVGVEIVTSAPFAPGSNAASLLVNNPSAMTLDSAHLFLEFVNISGTVVSEIPLTVTLPPGPTYTPVSFNSADLERNRVFQKNSVSGDDYIVMAFLTDYAGNILDTAGRPLSSFQADPLPTLTGDAVTWNFGTVAQGTLLKTTLPLANTGFGALYTYLDTTPGLTLQRKARTVGAADTLDYELAMSTAALPVGPYDQTATLHTSDPARPTVSVRVTGQIAAASGDTDGGTLRRPLDVPVTVQGPKNQGDWVEFTHSLGPTPQTLHPVKVYSQNYATLYGVGKYGTSFGQGTASYDMFGDGRDGDLVISSNTNYAGRNTGVTGNHSTGSTSIQAGSTADFNAGDLLLIHQTRGAGAGNWEINRIVSVSAPNSILEHPLEHDYMDDDAAGGGPNQAQILVLKQYANVTVQPGVTLFPPTGWDGSKGGIVAFLANSSVVVSGTISVDAKGFRGGQGGPSASTSYGYKGEGDIGSNIARTSNNDVASNGSGGGGATKLQNINSSAGAGGGGHITNGNAGQSDRDWLWAGGHGGNPSGTRDLSLMVMGGGGGGGAVAQDNYFSGRGGNGGGIVYILARDIKISGLIAARGETGGDSSTTVFSGGAGGGAGGSVFLKTETAVINAEGLMLEGGAGGAGDRWRGDFGAAGGSGSNGQARLEYSNIEFECGNPCGITQPPFFSSQSTELSFAAVDYGSGSDGDLLIQSGTTVYNDDVRGSLLTSSIAGTTELDVNNGSMFSTNDEVIVLQMRGTGVGTYEFGTISGIQANTLTLKEAHTRTFTVGGDSIVQVIKVPHYRNIQIQDGGKLTVHSWDGNTGGVFVARIQESVTVDFGGTLDVTGVGFRTYVSNATGGGTQQYQGESYTGTWSQSAGAIFTAGGGGRNETGDNAYNGRGAGGGGHQTPGGNSHGAGGGIIGQDDLSEEIHFGGAGGHGGHDWRVGSGTIDGSNGGGILILFSKMLVADGQIVANGQNGRRQEGGGGGGAGGSLYIITESATVGGSGMKAAGGIGGNGRDQSGGAGGLGRIHLNTRDLIGTTTSIPSMKQLAFYIVDQSEVPNSAIINTPESVSTGQSRAYQVQFGRKLDFTAAGSQVTTLRIPAGMAVTATLEALISGVGSGNLDLKLDIGNDGAWDWQTSRDIADADSFTSPDLAAAFNAWWSAHGAPTSGNLDVPVKLYLSKPAQSLLSNLHPLSIFGL